MILNHYPTPQEYLVAANPDVITKKYITLISKTQAYNQSVPTINDIYAAYGRDTAVMFIGGFLIKLNRWVNVSEEKKLSEEQIDEVSEFVFNDFKQLKVSELSHCINLIKKGDYGDFYGSISPTMILSAFKKYREARDRSFAAIERNGKVDFNERAEDIQTLLDKE